jgi:putative component of toxin-antitoxin plasmid stabilization module
VAGSVPTMGGDTILHIPRTTGDDRELITQVCREVARAYVETQDLPDAQRREAITQRLQHLNTADPGEVNPEHGKIFEFKTVG